MRRIICALLALIVITSLAACTNHEDLAISGTSFDPIDYVNEGEFARYENALHGVIIEYPEGYERIGNLDVDGYISFEGDGTVIEVHASDKEHNDILTPEEYTNDILDIWYIGKESFATKYGKTSGFKAVNRKNGRIRIDFAVKGVDAFYHFAYETEEEGFTEEDPIFQYVMGSIRIDDGNYNRLSRMAARYSLLFEYVTQLNYITDINYVNHCLNSFELSKDDAQKQEALKYVDSVRAEIEKITAYEREEDEGFDAEWQEVLTEAESVINCCDRIEAAIFSEKYSEAQSIARSEVSYALSEKAERFVATINAELGEY